jgi:hypothetical protein
MPVLFEAPAPPLSATSMASRSSRWRASSQSSARHGPAAVLWPALRKDNPMTKVDSPPRSALAARPQDIARAGAALLLALAAPAVSLLPWLTTGLRGSGAAVSFPHGFAVTLITTLVVTAAACALGGLIAKRAALVAIPLGLVWWALTGLGVTIAGISLGHAHLTDWGIVLLAAAVAGAAAGLPVAARR